MELIVSIAIVAAISIAATFGLQAVMKKNRINAYKADLTTIYDGVKTYLAINNKTESSSLVTIKLGSVVAKGNVDEKIYNNINGLKCEQFSLDTDIYYKTENGLRIIYMKDKTGNYCDLSDVDNCNIDEAC